MQAKSYQEALRKLSTNIKKLRQASNKTQLQVSMAINIDISQLQRIESKNIPNIKFSTLFNLSNYFNISIDDLLK